MSEIHRYAAFISYSSADHRFARRLHRALESYSIPRSLGTFDLISAGGKKNRVYPVFRDREELPTGELGELIDSALKTSAALIVVCSPNSAASPWVQKEIEFFAGLGRRDRIFAIIPDDVLLEIEGRKATPLCFPPAFRDDAEGVSLKPVAADARKSKDGFRNASLKVIAGLVRKSPGDLINRDRKRARERRLAFGVASTAAIAALAFVGAWFDARAWRSDLTARASEMIRMGRPLAAATFVLGGLPERGAALNAAHADAIPEFRLSGLTRPLLALGPVAGFQFSNDGRYLIIRTASGAGALHDLSNPMIPPLPLGEIDEAPLSISGDGRFLLTRSRNGIGAVRDLRAPRSAPLSIGRVNVAAFSGDGRFLATQTPYHAGLLLDLRAPRSEPLALGDVSFIHFSGDGRYLLTLDYSRGIGALRDLRAPRAAPLSLGPIQTLDSLFVGERYLFTLDQSSVGVLRDLRNLTAAPLQLGPIDQASFSADGRFLLTREPNHAYALRDLRDVGAAPEQLGSLDFFVFSHDSRFLLLRDRGGAVTLRKLRDASTAPRPLGILGRVNLGISSDGNFLITVDQGGVGTLHDLRARGAPSQQLGPVDHFAYSSDGRFLLTRTPAGGGTLRDLQSPDATPISLGNIRLGSGFSGNSHFLFTLDSDGEGALRNLTAPLVEARREVCQASGHSLMPFEHAVRGRGSTDSVSRHLRGRPWNPCDWRGLLAVLPNTENGDGWFEGARQWVRLMQVRYGGGSDYNCGETTSRASPATRAARVRMCATYNPADAN